MTTLRGLLVDGAVGPWVDLGFAADGIHPNGAEAADHLVVTTPDLERTTAALAGIGLAPIRMVEGVPGRGHQRFRFFPLGTALLELAAELMEVELAQAPSVSHQRRISSIATS